MFGIKSNRKKLKRRIFVIKASYYVNWMTLFFTLIFIFSSFYVVYKREYVPWPSLENKYVPKFLVQTKGCNMSVVFPEHNPEDVKVKAKPIICKYRNSVKPLVLSNETSLWVDEDALLSYGIRDTANVNCCYSELFRSTDKTPDGISLPYQYKNDCKSFWNAEIISEEFVRINCTNNGTNFYTDFHSFVPIKKYVEERCNKSKTHAQLNVLMLGLDSITRLNFQRAMKNTSNYISNSTAFEMRGFNSVGDGKFGNIMAVTTGLFEKEAKESCFHNSNQYLNSCQFIWNDFMNQGYRTAFGENSEKFALFEHEGREFNHSPTDYYLPTFYRAAKQELGDNSSEANFCIGTRLLFKSLLTYVGKFIEAMVDRRFFGLFWENTLLQHNGMYFPQLADDLYLSFLKKFSLHQTFDKTVLILLGDHGFRRTANKHSETQQEWLDDRRPLLIFLFPNWFRHKYWKATTNLQKNAKRLITEFDVYETLKDLANYQYCLNNVDIKRRTKQLDENRQLRGISLFLPIPLTRTCKDAAISSSCCTCDQNYTAHGVNATTTNDLAHSVVDWINKEISAHAVCSQMTLNKILNSLVTQTSFNKNGKPVIYWQIAIEVNPGKITFAASGRGSSGNMSDSVISKVHALSRYRYRSRCMNSTKIKQFCFCKSLRTY